MNDDFELKFYKLLIDEHYDKMDEYGTPKRAAKGRPYG